MFLVYIVGDYKFGKMEKGKYHLVSLLVYLLLAGVFSVFQMRTEGAVIEKGYKTNEVRVGLVTFMPLRTFGSKSF